MVSPSLNIYIRHESSPPVQPSVSSYVTFCIILLNTYQFLCSSSNIEKSKNYCSSSRTGTKIKLLVLELLLVNNTSAIADLTLIW